MDTEEKLEFQRRLKEELISCRKNIVHLEENTKPVAPDKALGRLTRMESLNDQGVHLAALDRFRKTEYQLQQSLEKINEPSFGSCTACGNPIPTERLMALPESTRCVRCAK